MDKIEKFGLLLLDSFAQKLKEDDKPLSFIRKVKIYADESLLRCRRFGYYGLVDVDGVSYGSAIDWLCDVTPTEAFEMPRVGRIPEQDATPNAS